MFKNYLLIAYRNLFRNKVFTLINVVGLGVGLACCLLIFLFVKHELSFDKHQSKFDRMYRIIYHATNGADFAQLPITLAPLMEETLPQIEATSRVFRRNVSVKVPSKVAGQDDQEFEEERVFFADEKFGKIFDLEVISGSLDNMLKTPFTLMINEEIAQKYFSDADPVGQTLYLRGDFSFKIAGVFKDFPTNSHFHMNLLLPYENMFHLEGEEGAARMKQNLSQNWVISHSHAYVLLKENADTTGLYAGMNDLVDKHAPEQLRLGQKFSLEHLGKVHLHSEAYLQPEPQGDIQYVYIFAAIAIVTLIIAIINFVNISTAQSVKRAKEVGMRKVLGARKKQLFLQFLGESLLVCLVAFVLALVLVSFGLPELNLLTDRQLNMGMILEWDTLLTFGMLLITAAFLGGSYPAFYITQIKVLTTLKGKVSAKVNRRFGFRQVLVTLQFATSIALISGSIIIFQQLNFMMDRPMGFQQELMVNVPLFSQNMNNVFGGVNGQLRSRANAFEEELLQNPQLEAVTLSNNTPGFGSVSRMTKPEGKLEDEITFVASYSVDYDFLSTFDIELAAGRDFDKNAGTDHQNAFIINQTAINVFDWGSEEEALGKKVTLEGKEGTVIGVVKDFHYLPLQMAIDALLIDVNPRFFTAFTVKIAAGASVPEALAYLEKTWRKHFPEKAYEYSFLDENLVESYQSEQRLGKIISIFAAMAILVSCLGSYGLMLFTARQREKEIGVRKVLGASVTKIILMMVKEFTWLYLIAFVLAVPFAFYMMDSWLEDFIYRIDIGAGVFLISGSVALLIIWFTISYQSIRSALINPIDCLRDE
ncbi:ABC transporter permease [Flammeovirgaceae bacterium SG7u.111]|nr:ABC transporter permease [Flammeovirgaceae bacterium SG7u.132]WPO36453.1 ABC transporter permease [Flammeovirgaceae bacterium SG7u.111]